jgi:hypothetical protein
MTTSMSSKLAVMQAMIDGYGLGDLPDFDTTTANGIAQINTFNQIASKSLYTSSCPSATYNIFYQDVWVPGLSTSYQNFVPCLDKLGIDNSTCGKSLANYTACPYSRCIDTFSIISTYYRGNSIGSLVSDADSRYGVCTSFDTYLDNFHNNYVKKVVDNIGNSVDDATDVAKLAGRFVTKAKTPINSLKSKMNGDIKTLFTEVYNNLTQTNNLLSIFDPATGVFTGLDCRLLSEDGVNMKESLCVGSYNQVYFTLVTVGVLAFSLFLALCCIICFNVRHYKHAIQR